MPPTSQTPDRLLVGASALSSSANSQPPPQLTSPNPQQSIGSLKANSSLIKPPSGAMIPPGASASNSLAQLEQMVMPSIAQQQQQQQQQVKVASQQQQQYQQLNNSTNNGAGYLPSNYPTSTQFNAPHSIYGQQYDVQQPQSNLLNNSQSNNGASMWPPPPPANCQMSATNKPNTLSPLQNSSASKLGKPPATSYNLFDNQYNSPGTGLVDNQHSQLYANEKSKPTESQTTNESSGSYYMQQSDPSTGYLQQQQQSDATNSYLSASTMYGQNQNQNNATTNSTPYSQPLASTNSSVYPNYPPPSQQQPTTQQLQQQPVASDTTTYEMGSSSMGNSNSMNSSFQTIGQQPNDSSSMSIFEQSFNQSQSSNASNTTGEPYDPYDDNGFADEPALQPASKKKSKGRPKKEPSEQAKKEKKPRAPRTSKAKAKKGEVSSQILSPASVPPPVAIDQQQYVNSPCYSTHSNQSDLYSNQMPSGNLMRPVDSMATNQPMPPVDMMHQPVYPHLVDQSLPPAGPVSSNLAEPMPMQDPASMMHSQQTMISENGTVIADDADRLKSDPLLTTDHTSDQSTFHLHQPPPPHHLQPNNGEFFPPNEQMNVQPPFIPQPFAESDCAVGMQPEPMENTSGSDLNRSFEEPPAPEISPEKERKSRAKKPRRRPKKPKKTEEELVGEIEPIDESAAVEPNETPVDENHLDGDVSLENDEGEEQPSKSRAKPRPKRPRKPRSRAKKVAEVVEGGEIANENLGEYRF